MQMYFILLSIKIEKNLFAKNLKDIKHDVDKSIQMVRSIVEQRSLKSLMRCYLKVIPEFFQYEQCSIMFYDNENDLLYTITFGDDEDELAAVKLKRKLARSEAELDYINMIYNMKDVMLSPNNLIMFPVSSGITAQAYKTKQPIYFNNFNMKLNTMFVKDVDNIKSLKEIDNCCYCPILNEDNITNGMIQLYNKKTPILKMDVRKLEAISRFFGGCVQNIEDITKKLTTTLAVQLQSPHSLTYLTTSQDFYSDSINNWQNLRKPIETLTSSMKAQTHAEDAYKALLIEEANPDSKARRKERK